MYCSLFLNAAQTNKKVLAESTNMHITYFYNLCKHGHAYVYAFNYVLKTQYELDIENNDGSPMFII